MKRCCYDAKLYSLSPAPRISPRIRHQSLFFSISNFLFSTTPFIQSSDSLKSILSLHEMPYPPASTLTPRKKDSFLNAVNGSLLSRAWQSKIFSFPLLNRTRSRFPCRGLTVSTLG